MLTFDVVKRYVSDSLREYTKTLNNTFFKNAKIENSITNGTRLQGSEIGEGSFTSGINNAANAPYSAAIGSNNEVYFEANSAAALGEGTKAYSKYQLVHGKYNDLDANNNYAHIVGGGTGPTKEERKNIYTLDWEGNATFSGSIKTNASPETNDSLINLEYFNSNIPIRFFPYIEEGKNNDIAKIYVNDLDSNTMYKVKMDKPYSKVIFATKVGKSDITFLSSDASINKYNMYVASKTDTNIVFVVNSMIYEIDLTTGVVKKKYDPSFVGPDIDTSTGSIVIKCDAINDEIVDKECTWSSSYLSNELSKYITMPENGTADQVLTLGQDGNVKWSTVQSSEEENVPSDAEHILYNNGSITNVQQALDELFYVPPSILSFKSSPLPGDYEIGSIVKSPIAFTWEINKTLISQRLSDGDNAFDLSTETLSFRYTEDNISKNTIFTLTISDGKKAVSRSLSFNFKFPKYWGASIEPESYDDNFILNLSGYTLATSRNGSFTVNAESDQYIYFCMPVSWGTPTFNVGGFDGGFYKVAEFDFTNKSGYTEPYSIWRSDNKNLGSQTIIVK